MDRFASVLVFFGQQWSDHFVRFLIICASNKYINQLEPTWTLMAVANLIFQNFYWFLLFRNFFYILIRIEGACCMTAPFNIDFQIIFYENVVIHHNLICNIQLNCSTCRNHLKIVIYGCSLVILQFNSVKYMAICQCKRQYFCDDKILPLVSHFALLLLLVLLLFSIFPLHLMVMQ